MKMTRVGGIFVGLVAVLQLGLAPAARAWNGDWVFQNFTGNNCGWTVLSGVTMAYDPSQDATGNSGGSARFTLDYGGTGANFLDVGVDNVDCCDCNLGLMLYVSNYASFDCDVKWDPGSTVPLSYFNSNGSGIQVSIGSGYGGTPIASFTVPDAATNGWAHVSAPINTNLAGASFASIILTKTYIGNNGGSASFWLDNVELISGATNPPFVLSAVSTPGGPFTLQWTNVPATTYTVQRSTDMVNWSNLVSGYPFPTTGAASNSYTDPSPPPGRAFYRVTSP